MSDKPTEYDAHLREQRVKADPFFYPCKHDGTKKVRFVVPFNLPVERSEMVLAWIHRTDYDTLGAMASVTPALRAWVGDDGYDLIVRKDARTMWDVFQIMMDAFETMKGIVGTPGESVASTS